MKQRSCFKTVCALVLAMIIGAASASAAPWSFGVISDTQWPNSPDNKNPNSVAVNVISHVDRQFIDHGVKFVVAVGDVTDNGSILALDTRATFAQALYNAGIGFYPLRGNHESSKTAAVEFQRIFPQTQTGVNNQTPANALVTTTYYGAPPVNTGTTFTVGSNFNSPSADFAGLIYAFDYDNARFVLLDQFTPPSGASHSALTGSDVNWIDAQLSGRAAGTHAFVFGHKHLISENHVDTLFGSNPSSNPDLQNTFMGSLFNNGVRYYMGGHDHMHNRAIVTSPDRNATVQNIITASDSYKFYIPQNPSSDDKYNLPAFGVTRETPVAQELFTVGYYIVTVDGPRVTVDYYASPNGCDGDCDLTVTPSLTFSKRETFGYSLNGKEFLVPQGGTYTAVQDRFKGTTARILGGINSSTSTDYANRSFTKTVDTGWTTTAGDLFASNILTLWGMAGSLGSDQTDVYTISMTYDDGHGKNHGYSYDDDHDHDRLSYKKLRSGLFGLATRDDNGNWINAVDKNYGGTKKFVFGPWRPDYELGTYGIDPQTYTVWTVLNHTGDFAVTKFNDGNTERNRQPEEKNKQWDNDEYRDFRQKEHRDSERNSHDRE